jgi:hypothetical protein
MLLPPEEYSWIFAKPYSSTDSTPVGRVFLNQGTFVRNIDWWTFLRTADEAGTGPRAVCYTRSPEVAQLVIPQEFTQLPPQAKGLSFEVPCYSRYGGVSVKNPMGMAYVDGLGS